MRTLPVFFILGLLIALAAVTLLHAQTETGGAASANSSAAQPTQDNQAPDAMTKKITDLVDAGKYAEAQKLTEGLLIAYPNDQRLLKAKALIEKLLAPAPPVASPLADSARTPAPGTKTEAAPLTGMDKVQYNSLIELAREAQQDTDLEQQKVSLNQFMKQSETFLQQHPNQTFLWQLRATSAIILNQPLAGYEAGQKLVAAGAADSSDPNLQGLLAQLNNKGWLDKNEAIKQARYGWLLGTWNMHYAGVDKRNNQVFAGDTCQQFVMPGSFVEGYGITNCDGVRDAQANFRGTVLDSGQISWERWDWASSVWKPATFEIGNGYQSLRLVFTEYWPNYHKEVTLTGMYTKR